MIASLRRAIAFVWERDALFLAAIVAVNLFFARRTFGAGIWADNDSASHYAYLRYFVEEFHPQTGALLGWCPKYNLGLPYLLFNTPPLLYLTTGFTSIATGMTPLLALKLWMVAAFVSIPLLAFALARTFEDKDADLAKWTALATSLFSSELFGLEFFFKNGMLNPAFAVPFLFATLVAYRRAITAPFPRALSSIAWTGAFFALTMCTHTLSAYMACVALVGFAFGAPRARWGANLVTLGACLGVGVLLAAWWLLPSLPFGAKTDAAYTWIREPGWVFGHALDGSLWSSYPVGFFPEFITLSFCGFVANVCVAYGAFEAWRRRAWAFLGCALAFVLAMWISVGPRLSWGIAIAPMYDRLLWYRFVTLAAAMVLVMAGYGAWRLAQRTARGWPLTGCLLIGGFAWAFQVMTVRAVRVKTASSHPEFQQSVSAIASWLRDHGDKRGRLYSEFLGWGIVEATSVNYTREMLPVETGFEEVGGWIYENNPASQVLQKDGPYWYDPFPMIDLAPRYDVKYVVAGSAPFVHALSEDPRWTQVLATPPLVLFEAKRAPSRVEADGWDARIADQGYVRGGGYRYRVEAHRRHGARGPSALTVKTNASPGWTARVAGRDLATHAAADGLLVIDLPADLPSDASIDLAWSWDGPRRRGALVSLVGLGVFALLLVASRARLAWARRVPARALSIAGNGGAIAAVVALAVLARKRDLSHVGFGIADGLAPMESLARADVGRFDDDADTRPNRVVAAAWGERAQCGDVACRRLARGDAIAARVTLAPGEGNAITIRGAFRDGVPDRPLVLALLDRDGRDACLVSARLGEPTPLPAGCAEGPSDEGPGVARSIRIDADGALDVAAVEVKSAIAWLEAESFRNVTDDGGADAMIVVPGVEYAASNGVIMTAGAGWDAPVDLAKDVALAPGDYDAWALARVLPERFRTTRADVVLVADGRDVGTLDDAPARRALPFWEPMARFAWSRVGRFHAAHDVDLRLSIRWRERAAAALADVDAIALVPAPGAR